MSKVGSLLYNTGLLNSSTRPISTRPFCWKKTSARKGMRIWDSASWPFRSTIPIFPTSPGPGRGSRLVHQQGRQSEHALFEQGDSCFGVISAEGEVCKYLAAYIYQAKMYSDHSEWHHFIASTIEIGHVSILTKDSILDNHIHMTHLHSQHMVCNHSKNKTGGAEGELPHSDQGR